uniref:Beta-microseminoprotein n=1 Tax=Equus asinus TaxID=9793 RepID=A0A9L0K7P2_EQUAS
MNALLGSLLVLATFVTVCNAQCFVIPHENIPGNLPNECKDLDGVTHPMNSKWKTKSCQECSCDQHGISCCNALPFGGRGLKRPLLLNVAIPADYDTTKCEKIFNEKTCSYKVVERNDPEKTCPVSGWIM